ncbi:4Fe-4S binding protein [Bacteroides sp.]|uniref:ATP-binding protein n=1 Tax=Bacteroides sp. TaxID=29523 RepID=UPI002FC8F0A5
MKRTIIKIDESLCNGCGACIKGCHEGALQLIDGKARMISDLFCDGLGACIGECPVGAIALEEREAEPYDEYAVMERIAPKGEKTIVAHLMHLRDHKEMEYLKQGLSYLAERGIEISLPEEKPAAACGCPGGRAFSFAPKATPSHAVSPAQSQLRQWPVQLHLLNPQAAYFREADVVLAADCAAYAYGDFHQRFLTGKTLAIACPKLDTGKESYIEKLTAMIDASQIRSLTVVIMEVPCCGGLLQLARMAVERSVRKIPIKQVIVGIQGNLVRED